MNIIENRLKKLGVEAKDLPYRVPCLGCKGEEHVEYSYDLFTDMWTVWCGCGRSGGTFGDLIASVNDWNMEQVVFQATGRSH